MVVQDARDRSTSPSVPSTRDRLPSLTGLRFWAALLVVLYHLTGQVGALQPISAMTMFGRSGVTFFFVLSGFVLAWTYVDRSTRYRVFLWRRFARLWPLVVVTGVLSLLAFWAIGSAPGWWQAATTFLFLQAWHPDWAVGANGAAWSLSDEAFFYLLFPPLLAAAVVRRRRVVLWVVAACLLVGLWFCFGTLGWSAWTLDYLPLTRVVQFLVGVLCAVAMRQGATAPLGYWWAVGLVVVYHAALVPWHLYGSPTFSSYSGSQWWATPVFALLIMAAAQSDVGGRPTGVRGPWSLRLGHWSYAWYLIHEVVIRVWTHVVPRTGATLLIAVEWTALLLLSLAAAGVLYNWVERPSERWLRSMGPQN